MRFFTGGLAAVLVAAFGIGQASAASDPSSFSLAGLRLYMSEAEVRSVIQHFPRGKGAVGPVLRWLGNSVSCSSDWTALLRKRDAAAGEGHCISKITAIDQMALITVYLVEDFPAHPGLMRAFAIDYRQEAMMRTKLDRDELVARVERRYGQPDLINKYKLSWGYNAEGSMSEDVINTEDDFLTENQGGVFLTRWDAVPSSEHSAGDLDFAITDRNVRLFLYDMPYASQRSAALQAAYDAVAPPPLKTFF